MANKKPEKERKIMCSVTIDKEHRDILYNYGENSVSLGVRLIIAKFKDEIIRDLRKRQKRKQRLEEVLNL